MTSNLTTTGDIQGRNVSATGQLNAGGACILNSSLTLLSIANLNSTINLNGIVNVTAGRGTYGTGGQLNHTKVVTKLCIAVVVINELGYT